MKTPILTSFFLVLLFSAQAQTEAEQKAALSYIEKMQSMVATQRQYMLQANQVELDRQRPADQRLAQQKQYLEAGQQAMESFGVIPVPAKGEALREAALAYADQFEVILRGNTNRSYLKQGEAEQQCSGCLDALYRAHQLQSADLQKADALLHDLNQELDAFANVYSIALEGGEDDKQADRIRAANDYAMLLGLAVGHATQAHQAAGTVLQNVLARKAEPAALQAQVPLYTQAVTEARALFDKHVAKEFEGDKTLYETAQKLLAQLETIQTTTLPTLATLLAKTQLSETEKKQAQQLLNDFNAPAPNAKKLQEAMLAFLQKRMN